MIGIVHNGRRRCDAGRSSGRPRPRSRSVARAGRPPLTVRWPTTLALEEAGFVDAYRAAHPDEIARPGFTWTPITSPDDPADHHDRIDFVFARGPGLVVTEAAIVGERAAVAELVVDPWPSDHRAVVAACRF